MEGFYKGMATCGLGMALTIALWNIDYSSIYPNVEGYRSKINKISDLTKDIKILQSHNLKSSCGDSIISYLISDKTRIENSNTSEEKDDAKDKSTLENILGYGGIVLMIGGILYANHKK